MTYLKNGRSGRRIRAAWMSAILSVAAAAGAHATTVTDGSGFLTTYTGPHNGDLDAKSATAVFNANEVFLSATMDADIGTTAVLSDGATHGVYVWGVDRGSGTPVLDGPTKLPTDTSTPVGAGVTFDAFIVLQNLSDGTGSGFVALINNDGTLGTVTPLAAGAISYSGPTINVDVPFAMLPGNPADFADYGYNIWPRQDSIQANTLVASFLPADRDFTASAVPEPASWALMIAGFGLAGAALRRRRATRPQIA